MRKLLLLAALVPLYTVAPAFGDEAKDTGATPAAPVAPEQPAKPADDYVPLTLDKQTFEQMINFFRTQPMPFDVSSTVLMTFQRLEAQAKVKAAAEKTAPAEQPK